MYELTRMVMQTQKRGDIIIHNLYDYTLSVKYNVVQQQEKIAGSSIGSIRMAQGARIPSCTQLSPNRRGFVQLRCRLHTNRCRSIRPAPARATGSEGPAPVARKCRNCGVYGLSPKVTCCLKAGSRDSIAFFDS